VDRTTLTTDEVLVLTVVVVNANDLRPQLPALDGFRISNSSSSYQVSIVNGSVTSNNTFRYVLQPTRSGNLQINPVRLNVNGQAYSTEPIDIQVSPGIAPTLPTPTLPQAAPSVQEPAQEPANAPNVQSDVQGDIFVEALVDNPNPYLGEQILYIFRLYRAVRLAGQPEFTAPEFTGFWNQQETQQAQYSTEVNNRTYQVSELSTILFPTVVGERTLQPAELYIPGPFFSQGNRAKTKPVKLSIRPHPEPVPEGFNGAVGEDLTLLADIDLTALAVNEPLTLRLSLQGTGNADTWPDPSTPELDQWRVFESNSTTNVQVQGKKITGSRIYEQLMVPNQAGAYTIPAIAYTYFNPATETYETTATEPLIVAVEQGAADAPIPSLPAVTQQENVIRRDVDIRHIKPAPAMLSVAAPLLVENPLYWVAWLVPLLLLAIDAGTRRQRNKGGTNSAEVRRTQAQKKALALLSQARRKKRDIHETVDVVLTGYLTDRLSQPVAGMTQNVLTAKLQEQNIGDALITRVQDMLLLSEMGRFAPGNDQSDASKDLLKNVEKLIGDLEKGR